MFKDSGFDKAERPNFSTTLNWTVIHLIPEHKSYKFHLVSIYNLAGLCMGCQKWRIGAALLCNLVRLDRKLSERMQVEEIVRASPAADDQSANNGTIDNSPGSYPEVNNKFSNELSSRISITSDESGNKVLKDIIRTSLGSLDI
jgi:hypothetical protein